MPKMSQIPENQGEEYTPTRKEERLIEALLNPNNREKTITEVCDIAGCNRRTYYRAFEKPGFVELYRKRAKALASKYLGQVMNAFVREAAKGSFQHGKVILEMAEVYKETSRQEHTGKDGGPIEVVSRISGLSDEEKKKLIQQAAEALEDLKDAKDGQATSE